MPICFKLLTHCIRRAASRAACTAGKSSAIRTAMIAITTSSSIKVKPDLTPLRMTCTPIKKIEEKNADERRESPRPDARTFRTGEEGQPVEGGPGPRDHPGRVILKSFG